MMDCPFCKIQDSVIKDGLCYVIFDKYPVSEGHCLIIPKRHSINYFDCTKDEKEAIQNLIEKTKEFLDKKFNPSGYNIGYNCGISAGQTIFHTHIHVIPRYDGDMKNPEGGVRGVIPTKQKY